MITEGLFALRLAAKLKLTKELAMKRPLGTSLRLHLSRAPIPSSFLGSCISVCVSGRVITGADASPRIFAYGGVERREDISQLKCLLTEEEP